ncbi:hypothetical protein E2562_015715 [Oryza meyeriana var. granulata]|uniref:Leucine-rich repeat-containing N-terminal plant-type domain-containing protein n=1 Tax=Oryza meyeriana var. granulata TaxID=110450 RepID=A0A6G1D467_9ORYZ|nr:hypothetical protein E2562_015715 [Oryza meyeriana var. granulata]
MATLFIQTLLTLLLLLLTPGWGSAAAAAGGGGSGERKALLRFKAAVASDPGGLLRGWSPASPDHCVWPGVSCGGSGEVVALNVSSSPGRRLAGGLSPAVAALRGLRVLALPSHAFSGQLPAAIWSLRRLLVLDLSGNRLQGEIPATLACAGLQTLDLSYNQLNGSVPASLGALSGLRRLSLASNRLGGAIPDELGGAGCRSLQYLDLSGNLLVGGIPRSLGNCSKLEALLLSSNLLDDIIPPEIGRLRNLRALDVSRNSLSGSVPAELGGCVELSALAGFRSSSFVLGTDLTSYHSFSQNNFTGAMTSLPLAVDKLGMQGSYAFLADGNNIAGQLQPDLFSKCNSSRGYVVDISNNLITGGIPVEIGSLCGSLVVLGVAGFEGELAGTSTKGYG